MNLLLTSAGVKNASIERALVGLLGKPIGECSALCVPTSSHAVPDGPLRAWEFLNGTATTPMVELGWQSMGVLELSALPTVPRDGWLPILQNADVLLVNGGDPLFLSYWMRESGVADLLPTLKAVYVGLSAGSMNMAPRIGEEFVRWQQPSGDDSTLGLVDFAIFPHLNHPMLPDNIMPTAERWAARLTTPCYAIDDETAITVVDGTIEVISEGIWHLIEQ